MGLRLAFGRAGVLFLYSANRLAQRVFIRRLALFYVPLVLKFVPESVPYLLSRGKTTKPHRLVSVLEIQSGITPPTQAVAAPAAPRERIRFVQLWQHPFARRTLMLWLVWFGIVFSYYGIFTWLPKLLVEQGNTVVKTFDMCW